MRENFTEQIKELNRGLVDLGAMCESAIANATKALLDNDLVLAQKAIDKENKIDEKEREIENLCYRLLLKQQPVATDLRLISSALRMITDLERIGDQAADISEIVITIDLKDTLKSVHIAEMAKATIKMVTNSIDAFVKKDLELARSVIKSDDIVDNLFNMIRIELIDYIGEKKAQGENAVDVLMIAKYFERIGDHATNIAEWVEFSITGKIKGED